MHTALYYDCFVDRPSVAYLLEAEGGGKGGTHPDNSSPTRALQRYRLKMHTQLESHPSWTQAKYHFVSECANEADNKQVS